MTDSYYSTYKPFMTHQTYLTSPKMGKYQAINVVETVRSKNSNFTWI